MTDEELMQQALEALEWVNTSPWLEDCYHAFDKEVAALRERLAQPEQKPVAWGVFDGPNLHDVNFTEEEAQEMMRLKGDGSVVKPLYTSPPASKPWVGLTQPEQSYPDNFIDALKYDVAKRDSEAQQAYEDAFVNGTGVMLGDKRIDPAIIYKQPEQEPVARSDAYDMIDRFLHNNLNSDADYAEYSKALDSIYTIPPQRKPLSMQERTSIVRANKSFHDKDEIDAYGIIDDVEAAHGIKE